MGKGDKRSFKGKVFRHSYGKTRPRHGKKAAPQPAGGTPGPRTKNRGA
jgi:ribosomal small subunit protein bTHX